MSAAAWVQLMLPAIPTSMENAYGYGPGQWGFAGQVGAGITYALSSNIDVDFGYRFKAVTGIDFDDNDGEGVYSNGKLYTHSLQVGFNVKF